MIVFPNAKINIGLYITEKRTDGFHNISSVFYPVAWADALEAVPASTFQFGSTGLSIPGNKDNNLTVKAFNLLKPLIGVRNAHIHLHKVIPMGAGLGGGSADGAFALQLFNQLFELNLSNAFLCEQAALLGSDCPFFIENKPRYCFDRGTSFEDINLDLSRFYLVLVNPEIHIGTAEAYGSVVPKIPEQDLRDIIKLPINSWKDYITNDFEKPALNKYPVLNEIKSELYKQGALYAAMTGSGSTLFGIFEKPTLLKNHFAQYIVWEGKML